MVKALLNQYSLHNKIGLEIGYGSGDMLNLFAQQNLTMYAYDYSDGAYQMAQDIILPKNKSKINLLKSPQATTHKKYDYIFAFEVLEHIENDTKTLKSWHKLLKPNGTLIFSVPAHMSDWSISDKKAGHYRRYEQTTLTKQLESLKFTVDVFWNYGYPLTKILDQLTDQNFKRQLKTNQTKDTYSQLSGIRRSNTLPIRLLSNRYALWPFFMIQNTFKNTELGNSYLVAASIA